MLNVFFYVFLVSLCIVVLAGTFLVVQYVVDRFLLISLPLLVETYGRWRYPEAFKEKE